MASDDNTNTNTNTQLKRFESAAELIDHILNEAARQKELNDEMLKSAEVMGAQLKELQEMSTWLRTNFNTLSGKISQLETELSTCLGDIAKLKIKNFF